MIEVNGKSHKSPPIILYEWHDYNRSMIYKGVLFRGQLRSISNFSCSLTRNITSHRMKNLAFHNFDDLPILITAHIHVPLKGGGNVLFELRSERVKD